MSSSSLFLFSSSLTFFLSGAGASNSLSASKIDASKCAMTCGDDSSRTCGGQNSIDVYSLTSSNPTRRSFPSDCTTLSSIPVCPV
jgi:hypothetical protein